MNKHFTMYKDKPVSSAVSYTHAYKLEAWKYADVPKFNLV